MKQKSNLKKLFAISALFVIGGFAGFLFGKFGIPKSTTPIPLSIKVAVFSSIIPIFFFVIAWHEGGHAIAGIRVGFDFRMYVVGPFMWEKQNFGWQFKWNKNVNMAGGLVLCLPKNSENLSTKFSIFAAAGPISSLILAVFAYVGYKYFDTNSSGINIPKVILLITAFISLLIFIMTSIPLHVGGFYTDGARVLRLQKGGEIARFEILMLKTIAETSSGTRPKMLNTNELEEILVIAKRINDPFGVYIHGILHQAAFDNGELEKAEKHLQNYINEAENIPDGIRNMVWLDAAFFYAFAKKDLEKSEYFWAKFKPAPMIPKSQILATEASLSFLKNEPEITHLKIEEALKQIPNMIDKGMGFALKEKLDSLK